MRGKKDPWKILFSARVYLADQYFDGRQWLSADAREAFRIIMGLMELVVKA